MNVNDRFRWVGLLLLAVAGCSSNNDAPICGDGDDIAVEGESYCVYRSAVVVENGFACPSERPNLTQEGNIGVCSPQEMLSNETLELIGMALRDRYPAYDTCILDYECGGGVCRPEGCVNVLTNNTTNNTNGATNNTTGATNNAPACTTSSGCVAGQICENGVCVDACGGILGSVCKATDWCDYPVDTICGEADMLGTCRPRPEACTDNVAPVCGCDGVDYSNECEANAGGSDVAMDGTCI